MRLELPWGSESMGSVSSIAESVGLSPVGAEDWPLSEVAFWSRNLSIVLGPRSDPLAFL
jgi:hypothetical protein